LGTHRQELCGVEPWDAVDTFAREGNEVESEAQTRGLRLRTQVSCRDYRESILMSLPHRWARRDDTSLNLAHYHHHHKGKGEQKKKLGAPPQQRGLGKGNHGVDHTNPVAKTVGKVGKPGNQALVEAGDHKHRPHSTPIVSRSDCVQIQPRVQERLAHPSTWTARASAGSPIDGAAPGLNLHATTIARRRRQRRHFKASSRAPFQSAAA
jgi:hypothetical protein